jgi:hypothetical protein
MAYDNPGPGKEDLYDSGGGEEKAEKYDEGKDDSPAATLPKSILGGKKFNVGDEVVLKITHLGDEEVTVTYAPEEKDESEKEEGGEKEMAEAPSEGPQKGEMASAGGGEYD